MQTFAVIALGCKVNQYEAACYAAALQRLGLQQIPPDQGPDLCLVQTCQVTTAAMRKSRQAIHAAKAARATGAAGAAVVVTGCGARPAHRDASSWGATLVIPDIDQDQAIRRLLDWVGRQRQPDQDGLANRHARHPGTPHASSCKHGETTQAAGLGLSVDKGWIIPTQSSIIGHGQRPATDPLFNIVTPAPAVKPNFCATPPPAPISDDHPPMADSPRIRPISLLAVLPGHARAFVKVQDGCDAHCSFCIVPTLRPLMTSRPIDQVVAEVRSLVANGFREIVLAGIFLGAFGRPTAIRRRWAEEEDAGTRGHGDAETKTMGRWGDGARRREENAELKLQNANCGLEEENHSDPFSRDTKPRSGVGERVASLRAAPLVDLLDAVCRVPGLGRVRMSSLEPGDVTATLLARMAGEPRIAPHLHVPLQSGSNRVLKRMNRQYDAEEFARAAGRVRAALDRPAVTTDIIVGFPGETEQDFQATLAVTSAAGFARIHTFRFSPRPDAPAARWKDHFVPPQVVRERLARLAALAEQLDLDYRRQFVSQTERVVIEWPDERTPGVRRGRTGRYFMVHFPEPPAPPSSSGDPLARRMATVRIDRVDAAGTWGSLISVDD